MELKNVYQLTREQEIELAVAKTSDAVYSMTQLYCYMTGAESVKMSDVENVLNDVNTGALTIKQIEIITSNRDKWDLFTEALTYTDESIEDELATEKALSEFIKWVEFDPAKAFIICNSFLADAGAGIMYVPEYRWREFEAFIRDYQETGLKSALEHFIHTYCITDC